MDGENKDMLSAIYADMDPSNMGSNKPETCDQIRCETR